MDEETRKALDSDWVSSSDVFKHQDFHEVVKAHDYMLVNFYADWCSHCRDFHPTWVKMADRISDKMQFQDSDGKMSTVKMLKVNCVVYETACTEEQIQAF